jgi:hypothetical protein
VSIGYAWWENWNRSKEVKKLNANPVRLQDHAIESVSNKNSETGTLDTSSWKIYYNEKYGFEIKYPIGWKIEEMSTYPFGITVSPSKTDFAILFIYPINVGQESVFDKGSKVILRSIDFAGRQAKQYVCPEENICPQQILSSKSIRLTDLPKNWEEYNEIYYDIANGHEIDLSIVEQILFTFRFTK